MGYRVRADVLTMLNSLRRLLFLWLLMIWQGGFFFYSAVVVHIGIQLLGDMEQGRITQQVTNWLNLAGGFALTVWAWDIAVEPSPLRLCRQRWLLWFILAVLLAILAGLHLTMDQYMDAERFTDRPGFRRLHRWYLWISTVQWMGALILSWWTLRVWRGQANPASRNGRASLPPLD